MRMRVMAPTIFVRSFSSFYQVACVDPRPLFQPSLRTLFSSLTHPSRVAIGGSGRLSRVDELGCSRRFTLRLSNQVSGRLSISFVLPFLRVMHSGFLLSSRGMAVRRL